MTTKRAVQLAAVLCVCFLFLAAAPGSWDGVAGPGLGSAGVAWADDDDAIQFFTDRAVYQAGDTVTIWVRVPAKDPPDPACLFLLERLTVYAVYALYFEAWPGQWYSFETTAGVSGTHYLLLVASMGDEESHNWITYDVVGD